MKTVTWKTTQEQFAFLESQGKNVSKFLRALVARVMPGGDLEQVQEATDRRAKATRFLEAVEKHFVFHKSCRAANVCADEMTRLIETDPEFSEAYVEAQSRYIDEVEDLVILAVRGTIKIDKTAMVGLIAWLNNNHPNWGRVKTENLQRAFQPLFQELLKAVKAKVNPSTYKEICKEFDAIREARFLSFSD